MKSIAIGLHLRPEDVEPVVPAVAASGLVVSAIEISDDQPLSDRDLLLRVASLRALLLERATFIAVRYGFTFRSTGEAESKLSLGAARWREILETHRSRVELTLKAAAAVSPPRPEGRDFRSGAAYMRALYDARSAAGVSDDFRREVDQRIGAICFAHRWMARDASSVEFAGLIERDHLPRLAEAGQSLKQACPDVPFLLSAPWPLEVFADADHQ